MSAKRRMRDFQRCLRSIQSFSNNQAQITEWDDESLSFVKVCLVPKDGPYVGGKFEFTIMFDGDYPKAPPRVDCNTPMYHPNIDSTCDEYNVCLNLFDEWDEKFGLDDVIQGLLFLLYNPNVEDPLSPYFDPQSSEEEMQANILSSLKGDEIVGTDEVFPANFENEEIEAESLAQDIELILEKASQVALRDIACSDSSDEEEQYEAVVCGAGCMTMVTDVLETEANNSDNSNICQESNNANLVRQESKLEKSDLIITDIDCDRQDTCDNIEEASGLGKYIPQTFIPTQPDFLVTAFMTCVNLVTR